MISKIVLARAKETKRIENEGKAEKKADCLLQNQLDYYRNEYNKLKSYITAQAMTNGTNENANKIQNVIVQDMINYLENEDIEFSEETILNLQSK